MANILGDVLPLIAGDLAQDALQATLQGNLTQAAALTERAAALRPSLINACIPNSKFCSRISTTCVLISASWTRLNPLFRRRCRAALVWILFRSHRLLNKQNRTPNVIHERVKFVTRVSNS